jgi:DNA ligase-1
MFPTIYAKKKTGKVKQWTIKVESLADGTAKTITESGFVDGKKTTFEVHVTEGKNLGKSNETTPLEQATKNAQSKWNKKKDEGYIESYEKALASDSNTDSQGRIKPMLAGLWETKKHKITFPAYNQPKLDGVRCLLMCDKDGNISFISRGGKVYTTLGHIAADVKIIPSAIRPGDIYDGEVYAHNMAFQDLTAAVKKTNDDTLKLQFHVYDVVNEESQENRLKQIKQFAEHTGPSVQLVETKIVKSEDELVANTEAWEEQGYEGSMVRDKKCTYQKGYRSTYLLKVKKFVTEEFEIIGGYEGVGTHKGACTFIVKTEDGKEFHACPKGTMEQKRKYFEELDTLIGKMLTVQYQELSKDGIPRFPVGIAIRDYE